MFQNLFKRRPKFDGTLVAYASGRVLPISQVKDDVFSTGVFGDGLAIDPEGDQVTAPCQAEVTSVMPHAVGLRLPNGAEFLLHVGLETVELNGEGMRALVRKGETVRAGQPLIAFDSSLIRGKGYDLICILVLTNGEEFPGVTFLTGVDAVQSQTPVMRFPA